MNRRTFLKWAGASAAAPGLAAMNPSAAEVLAVNPENVKARNRNRSTVVCRHGMACTSQPLATVAALDVLKAGGNAIDAAIAANAMLGLVEPMMNGIGSDLFAIAWIEKEQRLVGLNASGRSAYDFSLKDAKRLGLKSIPRNSPLSWNVPGCVSGWAALSGTHGKLPLAKIVEPAVRYALEGFPVSPVIARDWKLAIEKHPTLMAVFAVDGRVPEFGDIFANHKLAAALEAIGKEGADAFYRGESADRIVAHSSAHGGRLSMKDFEEHTATWVDPVSTNYRGYDVWEIPPNGQGIAALQMLNMLETFDFTAMTPNSAEHLHLLAEAKKLAFEDRAVYYADPEFAKVPTEALISKEYGKSHAKLIDPRKAATELTYGDPALDSDTIYLTTADDEGNMVSFIQSVYSAFGSQIAPDGTGFAMQNRGQSFSLDPKHRNCLEPHKRPFHTIIPAFMTKDGKPVMSFGVMGGDFQPQGHVQIVMNIVDFHMSPQDAGDQPRIAHSGSPEPTGGTMRAGGVLEFEEGIPDSVKVGLAERGHRISPNTNAQGGYQAIWREEGPRRYFGASDPRKDGMAAGY